MIELLAPDHSDEHTAVMTIEQTVRFAPAAPQEILPGIDAYCSMASPAHKQGQSGSSDFGAFAYKVVVNPGDNGAFAYKDAGKLDNNGAFAYKEPARLRISLAEELARSRMIKPLKHLSKESLVGYLNHVIPRVGQAEAGLHPHESNPPVLAPLPELQDLVSWNMKELLFRNFHRISTNKLLAKGVTQQALVPYLVYLASPAGASAGLRFVIARLDVASSQGVGWVIDQLFAFPADQSSAQQFWITFKADLWMISILWKISPSSGGTPRQPSFDMRVMQ